MASSFSKGFAPSTDRSDLDLFSESPCSFSERGFGLHGNPQTLSLPRLSRSIHACRSTQDDHTSRSSKVTAIRSFVIAATTAVGLSLCPIDCFAIAAELDSAVLSVASVQTNPNIKPVSGEEEQKVILVLNRSHSSKPDQDLSFSMAIPVPYEKVWADVQIGFVAPLPHIHEHGSVTRPLQQPRRTAMASSEGSALQCPRWTPSDLEMVLPDYHGRPKPFPHQGRHWSAAFVMRASDGEPFLQVSAADDELPLTEIGKTDAEMTTGGVKEKTDDELRLTEIGKTDAEMTTGGVKEKADKKKMKGNSALLEALAMEKSTCFSM